MEVCLHALLHCSKNAVYYQVRLFLRICLQESTSTPFNHLFRQMAALSLLRLHITPKGSTGILTCSAIGLAVRLSLRTRLTLIRLALIRKPSLAAGRFLACLIVTYTYICFSTRSSKAHASPSTRSGMLPYRCLHIPKLR